MPTTWRALSSQSDGHCQLLPPRLSLFWVSTGWPLSPLSDGDDLDCFFVLYLHSDFSQMWKRFLHVALQICSDSFCIDTV